MSDKELLELAAKAEFGEMANQMIDSGWNPLTDDGDALRLAVKLGLTVSVNVKSSLPGNRTMVWTHAVPRNQEQHGDDPCAATRRAIVRAAAEMGKAMP